MTMLPATEWPAVVRTDFSNDQKWRTICKLIKSPVNEGFEDWYANVTFVENPYFENSTIQQIINGVPGHYNHSFLFIVDEYTVKHAEGPVLVVDLHETLGRCFRAIPTQIQGIENNLSISNMDFHEFADNIFDEDGIFRGFSPKN